MTKNTKLTEWLSMLGKIAELDTSSKTKKHVITVDQARSLLAIMQSEGLNLSDYARALDLHASTISKNAADLGAGNGRTRKGMGLIELALSPQNMSHKLAYLTQKGRDLRDELTKGAK